MGRFTGKTAVVTGSGRRKGLGEAIALRLASEGAAVVISDIVQAADPATPAQHIGATDEMEAIAADIRAAGGQASTCVCDVRDLEQMRALAHHARDTHGSLDIWVNNAGIGYIMKPLLDVTANDWRAVIDVNLTGCFFGIKAAAEVMVEQGKGGRIINIASQAAKSGFPHAQAYTSSKHGLVGLVRSAAIELGPHQITVNNVCPNHVTTGWAPGRTSISPRWSARPALRITSRPWPTASRSNAPANPKTPPRRSPSCARMKLNTSRRKA